MSTPTLLRPTDLAEVRDAVLDSAGTLAVAGAGTAAAAHRLGGHVGRPGLMTRLRPRNSAITSPPRVTVTS